jgi:hypothetical protein
MASGGPGISITGGSVQDLDTHWNTQDQWQFAGGPVAVSIPANGGTPSIGKDLPHTRIWDQKAFIRAVKAALSRMTHARVRVKEGGGVAETHTNTRTFTARDLADWLRQRSMQNASNQGDQNHSGQHTCTGSHITSNGPCPFCELTMWKPPRTVSFYVIQVALMMLFVLAAAFFQSRALLFVWAACALALGYCWNAANKAKHEYHDKRTSATLPSDTQDTRGFRGLGIAIMGAGTMAIVGYLTAALAQTSVDFSLVGVPHIVPIGSAILGYLGASGVAVGARLFRHQIGIAELLLFLGASALTMVFTYGLSFLLSDIHSLTDFLSTTLTPHSLVSSRSLDADLAPWPKLTPVIQAVGYLVGGAVAFVTAYQMKPKV